MQTRGPSSAARVHRAGDKARLGHAACQGGRTKHLVPQVASLSCSRGKKEAGNHGNRPDPTFPEHEPPESRSLPTQGTSPLTLAP